MMSLSAQMQLCSARPTTLSRGRAPRRLAIRAATVNDPQRAKEDKERRRAENPIWQEPSNKNPLEKTTFTRETPIGSETSSDENPIREATDEIGKKAGGALDAVTEGLENAGDAIKEKIDEARGKA